MQLTFKISVILFSLLIHSQGFAEEYKSEQKLLSKIASTLNQVHTLDREIQADDASHTKPEYLKKVLKKVTKKFPDPTVIESFHTFFRIGLDIYNQKAPIALRTTILKEELLRLKNFRGSFVKWGLKTPRVKEMVAGAYLHDLTLPYEERLFFDSEGAFKFDEIRRLNEYLNALFYIRYNKVFDLLNAGMVLGMIIPLPLTGTFITTPSIIIKTTILLSGYARLSVLEKKRGRLIRKIHKRMSTLHEKLMRRLDSEGPSLELANLVHEYNEILKFYMEFELDWYHQMHNTRYQNIFPPEEWLKKIIDLN